MTLSQRMARGHPALAADSGGMFLVKEVGAAEDHGFAIPVYSNNLRTVSHRRATKSFCKYLGLPMWFLALSCFFPEGPSTQYLRTLVLKTIPLMVFGTRDLKYWVLGPSGGIEPQKELHCRVGLPTSYVYLFGGESGQVTKNTICLDPPMYLY